MWAIGHLKVPAALLLGKESPVPIHTRLDGSQDRSGRYEEEKNLCRPRESNPISPGCTASRPVILKGCAAKLGSYGARKNSRKYQTGIKYFQQRYFLIHEEQVNCK
jgi:hypothetical protein